MNECARNNLAESRSRITKFFCLMYVEELKSLKNKIIIKIKICIYSSL